VILSTLLRPPEAPSREEQAEAVGPPRRVLSETRERGRRYRRAVAIGIIVSVMLHVLAVLASSVLIRRLEPGMVFVPLPRPIRLEPEGTQVVEYRVVENPPAEPAPARRPEPEPPVESRPSPPVAAEAPAEPTASAAERLRPRVGDWRLWVAPPLAANDVDRTRAEQMADLRARLAAAIQAGNDSLAAELVREAEAMDWTVGEEGNKWGVSPGKLHLGPVTLPLPLLFQPHPATAREQAERAADWSAIQRQAGQAAIDETFEERVKAIRERKERQEAKAKRDTTSGGG
jgi:hypothetical protein